MEPTTDPNDTQYEVVHQPLLGFRTPHQDNKKDLYIYRLVPLSLPPGLAGGVFVSGGIVGSVGARRVGGRIRNIVMLLYQG